MPCPTPTPSQYTGPICANHTPFPEHVLGATGGDATAILAWVALGIALVAVGLVILAWRRR